jgi:hypothetical protein
MEEWQLVPQLMNTQHHTKIPAAVLERLHLTPHLDNYKTIFKRYITGGYSGANHDADEDA